MADGLLKPSLPFGIPAPGSYGLASADPGVTAHMRKVSICLIQPLKNSSADCSKILSRVIGITLPQIGRATIDGERRVAWAGRGNWIVVTPDDNKLWARLHTAFGEQAALADQSDGRVVVSLKGRAARATLEKGCTLDLHPSVFSSGGSALTLIEHVAVHILQVDDAPVYELITTRSSVGHLWHWLTHSAAEFGLHIEAS